MFGKLKSFFKGEASLEKSLQADKGGQPSDRDLQIACLVLLIEMAGSDQGIASQEAEAVCASMHAEFGLEEAAIPELVQLAIASRKEQGKIDEFVRLINMRFSEAQRIRLLAMIWKIVLADGKVDKFEQRFAVQMYNRFQLNEEQAEKARNMAEGGEI
jgi:uncharacterized tellurite resistance protein B-like protein